MPTRKGHAPRDQQACVAPMYQWPDYGSILAFVFGPRGELSRQHHRVNAIEKTPQERGSPG